MKSHTSRHGTKGALRVFLPRCFREKEDLVEVMFSIGTGGGPTPETKMKKIKINDLFQVGAHYGHQTRYWNPKMAEYIFTKKNKVHILDLSKTAVLFNDALDFIARTAGHGRLLFVGTKYAAQEVVADAAKRCGMFYVNHRWLGGTLTNYRTQRQRIKRLKDLEVMREKGDFAKLTKKEGLGLMREMEKLERSLGGIKDMGGLPDALFIIDVGVEKIAIQEANCLGIPVIAVVDSNYSPEGVDYVIPGNDDATRAIRFYVDTVASVISEVKAKDRVDAVVETKPTVAAPTITKQPAKIMKKEEGSKNPGKAQEISEVKLIKKPASGAPVEGISAAKATETPAADKPTSEGQDRESQGAAGDE